MECPRCHGSGICIECKGAGKTPCADCKGAGRIHRPGGREMPCARCRARGEEACNPRCESCAGSGKITRELQEDIHARYTMTTGTPVARQVRSPVSYFFIFACVALMLVETQFPDLRSSMVFYAPRAIHGGMWWQFITAQFVHAGLIHLAFNMWFLFQFGPQLEETIGSVTFAALYLVSGVAGFGLSAFMQWDVHTVGASGALFGVAAAYVGLQWRHHLFLSAAIQQLLAYLVAYVIFGFVAAGGLLNNWAHLGGGLAGLALGYFLPVRR